jgi:HK97 family phage major capsid protein
MRQTDQMLARYAAEIEERQNFIDGIVGDAESTARDLNPQEMELVTRARERIGACSEQIEPLREARRISQESSSRLAEIHQLISADQPQTRSREVEYRSAGAYLIDRWQAGLGMEDARNRLELYHRAAAHQTTGDNPGLLPEQILGPVINFVDASRPLVNALGPRQLPSGSWSRPRVTQHTQVGAQGGEKTELVSRKMTIGKIPVTAMTFGGYVNVSRQDIDWTTPSIMDIVIGDLAGQYAIDTEVEACNEFTTAATVGPTLGTGANTADEVAGALWGAAAQVLANVGGAGRILAVAPPGMMGLMGPLFPPVNPSNGQSSGFSTAALASGLAGSIAGIPIYVSNGMAANTILVASTAAAEVYEERLGSLQVVEPSVLGVQVAYAGYFAALTIEPLGLSKIVKTP